MASTYSTNLKLELIGTGEQSGVWGTTTNTNIGTAIEQAIVGRGSPVFSTDADLTLTLSNSSAAQTARAFVLNVTSGVSLTATRNLVVPTIEKPYVVMNNTTGGQSIVVKTAAGSGITVPNGGQVFLYVDGTNVIQMLDAFGDLTYTGTLTGGTGVVNLGSGQVYKAADGKVGIGTASPSQILEVRKAVAASASPNYAVGLSLRNALDGGNRILFGNTSTATLAAIDGTVASSGVGTDDGVIAFSTATDGTLAERARIDASGNLGLGVIPSPWGGSSKGIELAGGGVLESRGAIGFAFGANYYNNGSSDVNKAGGWAGKMEVGSGYIWKGATGVAGNATTLATMMTLDTIGNLLVEGQIYSSSRGVAAGFLTPDWRMYNTSSGNALAWNNGSDRMMLDASGNMGVSVTPSTWNASIKALSVGRAGSSVYSFTGSNIVGLTCNASYIASDWTYVSTDAATRYQQNAGLHTWYTAPSGTAGNAISWTQAMTLDASGNLTTANDRINLLTVGRGGGGVANNTASGYAALNANTTGSGNTASGYAALNANTTGDGNTANGYATLYTNTTGNNNTASGASALYYNTTGINNTASGASALNANTTGSGNTASGYAALYYNTTGINNTASGASALYTNTTGYNNTASGRSGFNPDNDIAQYRITTDFDMTLVGYGATKDNAGQLWNSTAIGARAKVTKSNQVVLGDSNVTETLINGDLVQKVSTTAATLDTNGTLTFSVVNDTTLRISVRGSDGTTRTATVALS